MRIAWFALSIAAMLSVALACYPALWLSLRRRRVLLLIGGTLILLSPLLVPPAARFLRLLASILAIVFTIKLYDLHVGASSRQRPPVLRFVVFLWNVFSLVDRRIDARPDPPRGEPWRWLAASVVATAAALVLAAVVFRHNWRNYPFALEHSVKVVSFFLVLFPFTAAAAVVWRMLGLPGRDIMHNPFAARTPADFWRRYNRPVHEFLEQDMYKPLAGRHGAATARAAALTFLVSGAIHEYVFAIPVGRVQGYQLAFFLLQGLAVAATARVKPRGWRVAPWVAATFAFNLATGVLFFASMDRVVPIYDNAPPLWDERAAGRRQGPRASLVARPARAGDTGLRTRGAELEQRQVIPPVVAGVSGEAGLRREGLAVEQPD